MFSKLHSPHHPLHFGSPEQPVAAALHEREAGVHTARKIGQDLVDDEEEHRQGVGHRRDGRGLVENEVPTRDAVEEVKRVVPCEVVHEPLAVGHRQEGRCAHLGSHLQDGNEHGGGKRQFTRLVRDEADPVCKQRVGGSSLGVRSLRSHSPFRRDVMRPKSMRKCRINL